MVPDRRTDGQTDEDPTSPVLDGHVDTTQFRCCAESPLMSRLANKAWPFLVLRYPYVDLLLT